MPRNRCTPQEGVTSLHGCVHGVERRQYAQTSDGVPARRDSTCRPGSGVPRRVLTTHVMTATPGQPGVRAPGAWWCGSARVRRSVAVGRHGAVRQGRRRHRGAGGRAGVARAASSVTVGPSRRRVRRALRQHPGAMRKPALWRGAPTEVVDLEGRRTRTVTLRAAGTPSRTPWRGRVLCGPPSAAPLPPCHRSHRLSSFF